MGLHHSVTLHFHYVAAKIHIIHCGFMNVKLLHVTYLFMKWYKPTSNFLKEQQKWCSDTTTALLTT